MDLKYGLGARGMRKTCRVLRLPSPQLPSYVLFPPSVTKHTRRCVAALEKREEIAREKRRRREKYKEEIQRYAPYVYLGKQED